MTGLLTTVVREVRAMARDVLAIELASTGGALPPAEAGAHLDLHLPNQLVRQYSLTRPATGDGYAIAVGLDAKSRGGSRWIHEQLRVGARLQVSAPRNNFALDPAHRRVLLIGGGIGITPIVAMARACAAQGRDWALIACARSAVRMAFLEELRELAGSRLTLHFDDEHGRKPFDFARRLAGVSHDGLYVCGPAPMMDAVTAAAAHWPEGSVRLERFQASAEATAPGGSFELVLRRSDLQTVVRPQESVLDAMERLGVDHPFSCREGLCGSCEVRVLEGEPEHRDTVLSAKERAANDRLMVCVSRCRSERLVLDA